MRQIARRANHLIIAKELESAADTRFIRVGDTKVFDEVEEMRKLDEAMARDFIERMELGEIRLLNEWAHEREENDEALRATYDFYAETQGEYEN